VRGWTFLPGQARVLISLASTPGIKDGRRLPNGGISGFNMDLTAVCPMVDNLNTGTATFRNNTPSTNAAGAVPWTSRSVSDVLTFAATKDSDLPAPPPWDAGAFTGTAASSSWYGTDRTRQEILKNVFDQINNQLAFAP
jgi:hypothetical protein